MNENQNANIYGIFPKILKKMFFLKKNIMAQTAPMELHT